MTRPDFAQQWQEDREGMLARLEAARLKAAEDRERAKVEADAAFQRFLDRQGRDMEAARTEARRFYYERRCVHCGAYFSAPTKEALESVSAESHGAGVCVKAEREARQRAERQERRREKHSARLAHLAGVSIVPNVDEGRGDE